uniref:Serine-rich adhesin for platelets-like n=1 Tax=Pundamilia nyererei TaxID=303518 RepID=A0A3B4FBZ3_9CICH
MDSSLLPASQNEYGKQRTGVKFTVRSANSPTYNLSRSSGVRKREGIGEVAERERYRKHTNTNGTNKDDDTVTGCETRTRSGSSVSTNRTIPEFGTDRRENPAFESQGRSAWRGSNLTSRSKSLDFKTGTRKPDPNTIADFSQLSNNNKGDTSKYAGALEGRRTQIEGSENDTNSAIQAFNSVGVSNLQERSELLERGSRGKTLPTRLRSLSGSNYSYTETSASLGPKSGQSIMERIEKLFGPTGFESLISQNLSVDEIGLRIKKEQTGLNDLDQKRKIDSTDDLKFSGLKTTQEMPHESDRAVSGKLGTDEIDFSKASSPEEASERDVTGSSTPTPLPPCDPSHKERSHSDITSPVSDDEQTPTNSPSYLLTTSPVAQLGDVTPTADSDNKSPPVFTCPAKDPDSSPRALPTSSNNNLQDVISPDIQTTPQKGKKRLLDLNAWIAGLNPDLKVFSDDEDVDDDESTQKDDDSNYDSDSGESSVTITSNMSQSDRRSFSVTLSDLCNFAGADYDSENDSDDWQSTNRRTASMSSDMSAFSCVSVMPAEELDKLVEEVRNLGDDALQDYDDVQVVVLHKDVGVGLGFSLAGGVDQNKPITVHKVFHSGVAAKQGSIKEGDQVLSINGTALSGSTHWEALRVLRRAKAKDMVVVVVRKGDIIDSSKKGEEGNSRGQTPEQYETGQTVSVQLQKNSRDLGFSLEGGEGSSLGNRPLTVQKIFQGGPVDMVYPGDEVLEVQGTSVVGMRRLEAWTLIRTLPPGPVDVVLRRSHKHPET